MSSRRTRAGFSTIELLAVLIVVSVLASIAAPAFTAQARRMRVHAVLDHFVADLYRARAYASRRGVRLAVSLKPATGCAVAYVIRRAEDASLVDSVPLSGLGRGVCVTSNVGRSMSINSRGMLVGSPRVVRASAGRHRDSVSISIAGRSYRSF